MKLSAVILTIACTGIIAFNINAQQADHNDLSEYFGFQEIEIIKSDWGIKDLRITDFNRDGRNDIAIVNNGRARIELLIQKNSIGPDRTDVAVDFNEIDINTITPPTRFEKQSIPVSQKVYSLVCGDLNSDGLTDMAFYGEPRGLYIILQRDDESEKDETKSLAWRVRKKININDGLLASDMLVCADLNDDGKDDLALAGRDGVYFIEQIEDGSLGEPMKYPTSAQTLSVVVGDLNGDEINDLILVTSDMQKPVHVRFGLRTGMLGPQVRFFIERPFAFKLENIDGIEGDEILSIDMLSGRLICYKIVAENRNDADCPILFYPLASGQEDTKRDLAVGDFDGNGLPDVMISDPGAAELIFYKQTAGIGLNEPVRFPVFSDIKSMSAADIDNDSETEICLLSVKEKVIGLSEFKNDRLLFPVPVNVSGEPLAMELADVDNSGSIDCIYISRDENDVRSLRIIYDLADKQKHRVNSSNRKAENFKQEIVDGTTCALELKKLTSNPDGLKVLDVDQDGLQDVLIFVSYELPILIRQAQKDKFEIIDSSRAQSSLIKDATLRSIAVADVDGKMGKELLVAQKNFARSLIFSSGRSWRVIDQYNAKSTENQISAVAAFNFDNDTSANRPDILLLDGPKGQLQTLKAGDDRIYRFEKELDVSKWNNAAHLKMLFAPLTGSGKKSLLLFDSEKFAIITGSGGDDVAGHLEQQFSYETKIKDGAYGNLTVGDVNSDGQSDIIMVEYKRNHVEILTLDTDTRPIPAMRFKIFEEKSYRDSKNPSKAGVEPRQLHVADVTGDGKVDLVTIIHDRIIIYPQD